MQVVAFTSCPEISATSAMRAFETGAIFGALLIFRYLRTVRAEPAIIVRDRRVGAFSAFPRTTKAPDHYDGRNSSLNTF